MVDGLSRSPALLKWLSSGCDNFGLRFPDCKHKDTLDSDCLLRTVEECIADFNAYEPQTPDSSVAISSWRCSGSCCDDDKLVPETLLKPAGNIMATCPEIASYCEGNGDQLTDVRIL